MNRCVVALLLLVLSASVLSEEKSKVVTTGVGLEIPVPVSLELEAVDEKNKNDVEKTVYRNKDKSVNLVVTASGKSINKNRFGMVKRRMFARLDKKFPEADWENKGILYEDNNPTIIYAFEHKLEENATLKNVYVTAVDGEIVTIAFDRPKNDANNWEWFTAELLTSLRKR